VYKVNNKVVAQPVKMGLRNEDEGYAEVQEGLVQGANVIVAKLDGVKPGHGNLRRARRGPGRAGGRAGTEG
jgi:hypothetical protein